MTHWFDLRWQDLRMAIRTGVGTVVLSLVLAACGGAPAATVRPTIATPSAAKTLAPATSTPPSSEVPMT